MKYLSICSGIEAATVAWRPMGWTAAGFAEIEKFPSSVLKHHYPEVQNFGDFTKIERDDVGAIDLLVGGTPCQDFSVAGLRAGMDGARGQLTIEFARLAERLRPRWLVWENVPGVLSIDGGRAFGTFLGLLGKLGYGFAYRVLDAQFFGVPQRRRRVFVVGHLGDWRRAAAVLFERHSLSGYPPPRRETGKGTSYNVAPCIGASGRGFERAGDTRGQDAVVAVAFGGNNTSGPIDVATAVNACPTASGRMDFESETFVLPILEAGARTGKSTDDPRAGMGDGIDEEQNASAELMGCLKSREKGGGFEGAVAFEPRYYAEDRMRPGGAPSETVATLKHSPKAGDTAPHVATGMAVRRLTPRECERLQGFPDDYTKISDKTADGPRYKALGNSMAVPVMAWIGQRMQSVSDSQGVGE